MKDHTVNESMVRRYRPLAVAAGIGSILGSGLL